MTLEINALLSTYLSKQIRKWPQAYFMAAIHLINLGIEMCDVYEHRASCAVIVYERKKGICRWL